MARWPKPPASGPQRDKLEREAAAEVRRRIGLVGGTILPLDQRREPGRPDVKIVAGRTEMLALVSDSLEHSAAYAAVSRMQRQDFMIVLADGTMATVPSSGNYYLNTKRHDDALAMQLASARNPPASGKRCRGRPSR